MDSRRAVCIGLAALALGWVVPARALVAPEQSEILVHRTGAATLSTPVAQYGPGGLSLVVWTDTHAGIRAQLYDADGSALGSAIDLVHNTLPASNPGEGFSVLNQEPAVAFLSNGDFLLAWAAESGYLQVAPFFQNFEVAQRHVFAQRFHAWGEPAGEAFEIAPLGASQSWPALEMLPRGGALAVWREQGEGLFARRLSPRGWPRGDALRLSAPGDSGATNATMAQGAGGKTLIAWESCCDAGADLGVFARVYDPESRSLGELVRLNGETAGRQRRPAAAAAGDQGFFVAYQSEIERSVIPIFGRFVDLDGNPVSDEVRISHGFDTVQLAPALAPTPDGGFLAVWRDWLGPAFGLTVVELGANGVPRGAEQRVNARAIKRTGHTSVATDGAGNYLIPWDAARSGDQQIGARRLHGE